MTSAIPQRLMSIPLVSMTTRSRSAPSWSMLGSTYPAVLPDPEPPTMRTLRLLMPFLTPGPGRRAMPRFLVRTMLLSGLLRSLYAEASETLPLRDFPCVPSTSTSACLRRDHDQRRVGAQKRSAEQTSAGIEDERESGSARIDGMVPESARPNSSDAGSADASTSAPQRLPRYASAMPAAIAASPPAISLFIRRPPRRPPAPSSPRGSRTIS